MCLLVKKNHQSVLVTTCFYFFPTVLMIWSTVIALVEGVVGTLFSEDGADLNGMRPYMILWKMSQESPGLDGWFHLDIFKS